MPKHHLEKNLQQLPGNTESFIKLLTKKKADREWIMHELTTGGPAHKQLYSNVVLQRLHTLVQAVEQATGDSFEIQDGHTLVAHKEEEEVPIPLLLEEFDNDTQEAVATVLSHAPAHEIIAFNSLLQGIEWCISSLKKANK